MSETLLNPEIETGSISVNTENIFPIIKKFLYSDHEIFIRELVSNAADACNKLEKLSRIGAFNGELASAEVKVSINKEAKTITVSDNGLGMTADEVKQYINQIAFSGATDFVNKYKDKLDAKDRIIGQFGLGFYSAFMVSDKVEIITKSYQEGAKAVRWECDGSTSYTIIEVEKDTIGTDIILHISQDSEEFLENHRLHGILTKYFSFLPVSLKLEGDVINEKTAAWTKSPSELSKEDYLEFYRSMYPMAEEPHFWIHLNVDHPFNLTGILYFPKLPKNFEFNREKINLYQRQVFITDEVKDIVPEFLLLLHGVIDSPDIPLNVSRNSLQADHNVKRITQHISKKVADKLVEMFNNSREEYAEKWNEVGLFVKYGIVSDDKFADRVKDAVLIKTVDGEYNTIAEYKEQTLANQTDKDNKLVWLYTADAEKQHAYIEKAKAKGYSVMLMDTVVDNYFLQNLEMKQEVICKRVDADIVDKLIDKASAEPETVLSDDEKKGFEDIYKPIAESYGRVKVEALSAETGAVNIVYDEFMRRFSEMQNTGRGGFDAFNKPDIVINASHPLNKKLSETTDEAEKTKLAKHLLHLALLEQGKLQGADLAAFIKTSLEFIN